MELRALCDRAFDPDLPAMSFDNVLGDGEAETCAADFARACGVDTVKSLKDADLVGLRDSNPRVRNRNHHETFPSSRTNVNVAAGGRVLNGVIQQIAHHFAKKVGVAEDTGKIPRHIRDAQRELLLRSEEHTSELQ